MLNLYKVYFRTQRGRLDNFFVYACSEFFATCEAHHLVSNLSIVNLIKIDH